MLASVTVHTFLPFVGQFLAERFDVGPIDLVCAADITAFVRHRATSIHSKRVQLMTTALRSFLHLVPLKSNAYSRYPVSAILALWSTSWSALNRRTAGLLIDAWFGRRDHAVLLVCKPPYAYPN